MRERSFQRRRRPTHEAKTRPPSTDSRMTRARGMPSTRQPRKRITTASMFCSAKTAQAAPRSAEVAEGCARHIAGAPDVPDAAHRDMDVVTDHARDHRPFYALGLES